MPQVTMRISGTSPTASASHHGRSVGQAKARNEATVGVQLVASVPNASPQSFVNSRYATKASDDDQRFDASLMNLFRLLKAVDPSSDPTLAAEGGNEIRHAYKGLPATSAAPAVLTSRRAWPYRP
jgi:hypothetical protein